MLCKTRQLPVVERCSKRVIEGDEIRVHLNFSTLNATWNHKRGFVECDADCANSESSGKGDI